MTLYKKVQFKLKFLQLKKELKMKKIALKILLIFSILFLTINESKGQLNCPSPGGLIDWWGFAENDYPADYIARAPFKYRDAGANTFDIKVDWSLLDKKSWYRLTDAQAKELLIQGIIHQLLPPCPNFQTYTFKFYEEKPCIKNATCYLKVHQINSVWCEDNNWPGGPPSWFWYNGIKYYPLNSQLQCGTACCVTEYEIECENYVHGQQTRFKIVNKTTVSFGCPESTTLDCKTGLITPCEVDCE